MTDARARIEADAALRESEERYRSLFAAHPHPMWFFDAETLAFLEVNDAAVAHYGFQRDEFLAMTIADIRPPEDVGRLRRAVGRVGQGAIDFAGVWRHRKKDGSIFLVEITSHAAEYNGRRAEVVLAHDITDRMNAEAALRESEERFRAMFDVAPVGIAQADPATGRWVAVNPRMCLITGYSADELLTMRVPEITHPEDRGRDWALFGSVVKGEAPEYRLEKRYLKKDGSIAWVNVNMVVLRDAAGRPTRTLAMIEDITERKRAQEEASRYVAGSPAVIYALRVASAGLRATWFSDNILVLTGYSPAEIEKDAQTWWESGIHPEDRARVLEANRLVLEKDEASLEFRFRRSDGSWLWVRDEKRLLRDEAGRPTEIVGSWMDVTARVRLEEQLRQSQKMEAVGQLAGGVAHDFNNLLTVISGNSDLLLSEMPADDPRRAALADIHAAGERAAALTRQLLAFSRKQILEPRVMDVNEVVTGIEKMLRRLIGEDLDLLTDLTADPGWVKVDPGQLEQVVMNLAVNARDAMPQGGRITIRTWNVDPSDPVDLDESARRRLIPKLALSISDTGTGMTPEVRARLFEPFFTTKSVGKGTGLGLATVYGIVKQSEGDITVESEPGKGTTFTIILPSQPAPQQLDGSGKLYRKAPGGTETVLIVEDEDAVRRIVKIALESAGYRVIEARGGLAALEAARTHSGRIHLVVTDLVMPEMSGREVAARIAEAHAGVRILYMSGYTDDAVLRHGIVESGIAFLQKPFSPLALARKVREVLDAGA